MIPSPTESPHIRDARDDEREAVRALIESAAQVYRGAIPDDCWHAPYMPRAELESELAAGVRFRVYADVDGPLGAIGLQQAGDVELIRHAYVRPDRQRLGIGAALMADLRARSTRPLLVGTWAAAHWAIAFYRRHGFAQVPPVRAAALLAHYWSVPPRQAAASVVLADPPHAGAAVP